MFCIVIMSAVLQQLMATAKASRAAIQVKVTNGDQQASAPKLQPFDVLQPNLYTGSR
jgi:hypothetical protein